MSTRYISTIHLGRKLRPLSRLRAATTASLLSTVTLVSLNSSAMLESAVAERHRSELNLSLLCQNLLLYVCSGQLSIELTNSEFIRKL